MGHDVTDMMKDTSTF